jgi:GNAT superfamily N-acetyltransferase
VTEEFCRRCGYRRIILDTPDRQEAARRLYERNGYRLYSAMSLPGFALLFYRKELE